jgi:diguanylate cyclase (GGDEF)-like protein
VPTPVRSRYWLAVSLGVLGLWLNQAPVPLLTSDTPSFLFGSAPVLAAFVGLGTVPGLVAAIIALLASFGRPGGFAAATALLFVLEAWVSCLLYRRFGSLVFSVAIFWFTAGGLLDLLLHGTLLGLGRDLLTLLFIQQILNGIANALLAEGLLRLPFVSRILPARDSIFAATLRQYVFNKILFVVMIPALALALLYSRSSYQGKIDEAYAGLERAATEGRSAVREVLAGREAALDALAHGVEIDRALGSASPIGPLAAFAREHSEFGGVALVDAEGRLLSAVPRDDTAARIDPALFARTRDRQRTTYSGLVGSPETSLLMGRPILRQDGAFRGALFVSLRPTDLVPSCAAAALPRWTLLDPDLRVIASVDPRLGTGTSLRGVVPETLPGLAEPQAFSYRVASVEDGDTERRYAATRRLAASGWSVFADLPASHLYAEMMPSAYRILVLLVAMLLALYVVVTKLAERVSEPLLAVNEATSDIAAGRFPGNEPLAELEKNPIEEIQSVARHFRTMRDALAYRDTLTGLPNRRLFMDRLEMALAQARRSGERLAVLYVDLDRFGVVDDSLGHAVGNELLRTVGGRLQASIREGDTVARVGADEFVVLVREVEHAEDAARVAGKLLEALRNPVTVGERELFVTASLGASLFPSDGTAAEPLLNNAHTAMHQAKGEGRDTYRLYAPAMNDRALEHLGLESELRKALGQDEFVVHYQPLYDLRSGKTGGAEALVRWQHPKQGLLAADQFIALAESSGLIVSIDSWVLRTACHHLRDWHDRGRRHVRVEVNLSARQFRQPDLVNEITRCLQETGVPPDALEIEITERTAMLDVTRTVEILRALRSLGVRISLDDFGTGYSSLSYLKTLPVDTVKLDKSFVRDVTHDPGDAAIATAVIAMAHSLKLRVVAEGVETPEQLAFLKEQKCDFVQGHLVSVALPAEKVEGMLDRPLEALLQVS